MIDKINMVEQVKNSIKPSDETYLDNGLLHCKACGSPLEVILEEGRYKGQKLPCLCECQREELAREEQRRREERNERRRKACFGDSSLSEWTFENAIYRDSKTVNACIRYAEQFEEFEASGNGLLLCGDVGVGKTYLAAAIANRVIDMGYTAKMTNFAEISNIMQESFEGRQAYLDKLNRCSLLVIDDLGIERNSAYMQEIVYSVIDSRYRTRKPLIITTNISTETIKKETNIEYSRIYDRILERCHPIVVDGDSIRRKTIVNNFKDMQKKLGL